MDVLDTVDGLSPERLSRILREKGMLDRGDVTRIDAEAVTTGAGQTADLTRLKPAYSDGAAGRLPETLILKLLRSGLHEEHLGRGMREAQFYQAVEREGMRLPVPAIFEAACEPGSQRAHILIQDLSATHYQKPLPIPPSNEVCRQIMESCAQLHAAWWKDPRLGSELGERLTPEKANAITQRMYQTVPALFDFLGDAMLPAQRKLMEDILASGFLNRHTQRLVEGDHLTLIHGDVHTGNLLIPNKAGDPVIMIDWQLWDVNVAAFDLAFLMALHWNSERRALLEKPLLEHYFQHLTAGGVQGFSMEDLWQDYRESVVVTCLVPIGQFRRKSPAGVIWFGLQDSLAAFRDLHCEEVL